MHPRSQLDSWNRDQIRKMQAGGNGPARDFFKKHGCTSNDANAKYNSRAANQWRQKLERDGAALEKRLGKDLLEPEADVEAAEEDFFDVAAVADGSAASSVRGGNL